MITPCDLHVLQLHYLYCLCSLHLAIRKSAQAPKVPKRMQASNAAQCQLS